MAESGAFADAVRAFIEGEGYRRCDVPACNCGSFHHHRTTQEWTREEIDQALSIQRTWLNGMSAVDRALARGTVARATIECLERALRPRR